MQVTFWGTRGSLPTPEPETARFGGNSSCVEVQGGDGTVLVLDAGTGIRRLGRKLAGNVERVDLLLTPCTSITSRVWASLRRSTSRGLRSISGDRPARATR